MGLNQHTINSHLGDSDESRTTIGRKIILSNKNGKGFIYQSITLEQFNDMKLALESDCPVEVIAGVRISDIDMIGNVKEIRDEDQHYFNQYVGDKYTVGPEEQGVWYETEMLNEEGKPLMSQRIFSGYEAFMIIVNRNGNHEYGVIYRFKEIKF